MEGDAHTMIFQRETIEFLPVTVTRNGTPTTTGIEFAITPHSTRPTTWTPPTTLGTDIGVMVEGLPPGAYKVWARITATAETPVLQAATFEVV